MDNPYKLPEGNVLLSISGGRTSGYMLKKILQTNSYDMGRTKVVFCNTGREMPETLDFVQDMSIHWGVEFVWLEYNRRDGKVTFDIVDHNTPKIKNKNLLSGHNFLKNKSIKSIMIAQKGAVERVFKKQGLKFRNFEILNKDEESLGIIFTYFMLETILLGKLMKLNPFDQPAVESIKKETKRILS